jgi:hypothetical protein
MANIAVYVMEVGQPALLYLLPCTLSTMMYLGWQRQDLRSLWNGPKADNIVFGREATNTTNRMPIQNSIGDNTANNDNNKSYDNRNVAST